MVSTFDLLSGLDFNLAPTEAPDSAAGIQNVGAPLTSVMSLDLPYPDNELPVIGIVLLLL